MKIRTMLAVAIAPLAFAIPAAHAGDDTSGDYFIRMADKNKDGMVSKAEAMKRFEEMFDKADSKKKGMIDKKQAETLLKMLADHSFGG